MCRKLALIKPHHNRGLLVLILMLQHHATHPLWEINTSKSAQLQRIVSHANFYEWAIWLGYEGSVSSIRSAMAESVLGIRQCCGRLIRGGRVCLGVFRGRPPALSQNICEWLWQMGPWTGAGGGWCHVSFWRRCFYTDVLWEWLIWLWEFVFLTKTSALTVCFFLCNPFWLRASWSYMQKTGSNVFFLMTLLRATLIWLKYCFLDHKSTMLLLSDHYSPSFSSSGANMSTEPCSLLN